MIKILNKSTFEKVKNLGLSSWEKGLLNVSKKLKNLTFIFLCEMNYGQSFKEGKNSLLPIIGNCSIKKVDLQWISTFSLTIQNVISAEPLMLTYLILTSSSNIEDVALNILHHALVSFDPSILGIDMKIFLIGNLKLK